MATILPACLALSALTATPTGQTAPAPDAAAPVVLGPAVLGPAVLGDVVVTAARSAQRAERAAVAVTVLDAPALRARQAVGVADLLAGTPGVGFTRNGGLGASTGISLRGAETHHTVLVIDGVKLNDPSSAQGGFNFGHLLVGDAARIEVLRGPQSTLWGSQAVGGVVHVISAWPTRPLEGELAAEAGARGTAHLRGAVGGTGRRLDWRLAGGGFRTDGFSAHSAGVEADGYEHAGASGRLRYRASEAVSVDLRGTWSDGRNDFDAVGGDSPERGRTRDALAYAGVNIDLMGGRFRNRLAYAVTDTARRNLNPARAVQPLSFQANGDNRRLEHQGAFAFTDDLTAVFGVERERSSMRTRSPTDRAPDPAFVRGDAGVDSIYGQMQWAATPALTLTAGLRRDDHHTYGGDVTGQAAAVWAPGDGATVMRLNFGQGFRAPGLYELYSEYGDAALRPEAFDAWEAGLERRLSDRATVSVTAFTRSADNEIRYNACTTSTDDPLCRPGGVARWGYYRNVLKTRAQGLEAAARLRPAAGLEVTADYAWTEAEARSGAQAGRLLPRRPRHRANLSAAYRWAGGASASLWVRHVGESFNNDANTVAVAAYTVVDVQAAYPVNDRLEIHGRVENLFDADYETILNYGAPRRGAFVGLRARF